MKKKDKAILEKHLKEAEKRKPSPIDKVILLGVSAMATSLLGSVLFGGMRKMFGKEDEIKVRDVVIGIIDGFMCYINEKDEKIAELDKKISEKEEEVRTKEKYYNEALESLERVNKELKEWRTRYMKLIKKSTKKK